MLFCGGRVCPYVDPGEASPNEADAEEAGPLGRVSTGASRHGRVAPPHMAEKVP